MVFGVNTHQMDLWTGAGVSKQTSHNIVEDLQVWFIANLHDI